jgi:5-methyltetrahydrofolate--homocysteine methyltransferase
METIAIRTAIIEGNAQLITNSIEVLLQQGVKPDEMLYGTMIPALVEVGELFEKGEYYLPEMLVSAHVMKMGLELLRPLLVGASAKPLAKVALGTVKGDIHDIGKNLVMMMLEGGGFEIVDLGVDVTPEQFVQAAREGAQVIGLSGMLSTTIPAMPAVIQALQAAGLRSKVKVIIGGAPVTEEYAHKIGADGYAADAGKAVKQAKALLGLS